MAQLVYEIKGDNISLANAVNDSIAKIQLLQKSINDLNKGAQSNGLGNAIAQANSQALNFKKTIDDTNLSLKDKSGLAALDQLGQKLLVIRGNADLFGQTLKNQQSELGAYQSALNRLLSAGFDPLDGDVLKLKADIDSLTASMAANKSASSRDFVSGSALPGNLAVITAEPDTKMAGFAELNEQFKKGTLTAEQYNAAISSANRTTSGLAASTAILNKEVVQEEGLLAGLNAELKILQSQKLQIVNTADLAKQNILIAETEAQIAALNNVGKAGFDKFGNAIKDGTSAVGGFGKGLTGAYGTLRQLAYILPGIGIAGIFNLAFEGISKAAESLNLFNKELSQSQLRLNAFNAANAAASEDIGKQVAPLKALYDATQNVNKSISERIDAAQQLRELYPAEFQNATNLAIVNGDLKRSYDELTESIISNARAAAAQNEIAKAAALIAKAQFEIDKINTARQNALNQAKTPKVETVTGGVGGAVVNVLAPETQQALINSRNDKLVNDQKKIIDKQTSNITFFEQYIHHVSDASKKLADANKLLGDNLQNFNSLLSGQNDKATLENIQKSLQVKLDTLAPGDARLSDFKAKLQKIKDLIAATYDVKVINTRSQQNTFDALKKQLDDIFNKSAHLSDQSGLTGYALEVQKINDKYKDLNRSIDDVIAKGQKDLKSGKITQNQFGILSGTAKTDRTQLGKDQTKELGDAAISEATRVANEIQRIRDEFGVRSEVSRQKELSQIQLRYDKEIIKAQGSKEILAAIESGRFSAIKAVNDKYLQLEFELWDKIATIDDQARADFGDKTSVETGRIVKEWETRRQAVNKYFDDIAKGSGNSGIVNSILGFNLNNVIKSGVNANIDTAKQGNINLAQNRNLLSGLQSATSGFISDFTTGMENANQTIGADFASVFSGIASSFQKTMTNVITNVIGRLLTEKLEDAIKHGLTLSKGLQAGIAAAGIGGALISGLSPKTSVIGQGLGGALSGAASGAAIGSLFGPAGTLVGGVAGGAIGLLGGIFGASKAQKELQVQQLEQAKQQTAALKASLAYTATVIGRMTQSGLITGVDVNATGQLVATVNGKDLQFVLDRNKR